MIDPEIEYLEASDDEWMVRRLWSSVILLAISDYYGGGHKNSAITWLFSGGDELNGFVHLSDILGFDVHNLRKTILKCKSMKEYRKLMRTADEDVI